MPPWLTTLDVLAWLAGALLGWLITGWVSRRLTISGTFSRHRGRRRAAAPGAASVGLLLLSAAVTRRFATGAHFWII